MYRNNILAYFECIAKMYTHNISIMNVPKVYLLNKSIKCIFNITLFINLTYIFLKYIFVQCFENIFSKK